MSRKFFGIAWQWQNVRQTLNALEKLYIFSAVEPLVHNNDSVGNGKCRDKIPYSSQIQHVTGIWLHQDRLFGLHVVGVYYRYVPRAFQTTLT